SSASHWSRQGRKLSAAHPELPVPDFVLVLEESAGRRPGRARAVLVVDAAVAGTHEQPRLLEPSNGAAQMRAVHGKHLELHCADTTYPARDLRSRPVPRHAKRVLVRRQARLALGKARHLTELDPCLAGTAADRPEEVADDRNSRQHGGEGAQ